MMILPATRRKRGHWSCLRSPRQHGQSPTAYHDFLTLLKDADPDTCPTEGKRENRHIFIICRNLLKVVIAQR